MGLFKKKSDQQDQVPGSNTGYQSRFNPPPNPGSRNLPPPGSDPAAYAGGPNNNQWQRYQPQPQGGYGAPAPGGYGGGAGYSAGGYDRAAYGGVYGGALGGNGGPPALNGYAGRPGQLSSQQQALEDEYGASSGARGGYDEYNAGGDQQQEERTESDEEVEAIKQQMRFTKQESLSATRNALRMAREAEETATNSMMRLGDQSEKLADTERNLDMSKAHAARAEDNAKQIVALNRSIFRPNLTWDKKGKRAAEEARIVNRHIEEREEREALRQEALQARNRVDQTLGAPGSAATSRFDRFGGGRFGGGKEKGDADPRATKLAQRSRYQFEATASDDELEDELDENMDEISRLAGRLNTLGKAMGAEIDDQNARIKRLGDKTSNLDTKIYSGTQRLGNIK